MLTTQINRRPIFWNGHLCEGQNLVAPDRSTFVLWTKCGNHDVPANAATLLKDGDEVTCEGCKEKTDAD